LMREGLAAFQATGIKASGAYQLTLVIEGHVLAGLVDEGLALLAEEATAARHPHHPYRGELQRLRGELLLRSHAERGRASRSLPAHRRARSTEAETCLRAPLDVARGRGARLLELRAAVSLGRLWWSQGNARAARELVEPLHAWFTEGLDTTDVQAAAALLRDS